MSLVSLGNAAFAVFVAEGRLRHALIAVLFAVIAGIYALTNRPQEDERDATEEEIAALEAEHGPFLPADDEG